MQPMLYFLPTLGVADRDSDQGILHYNPSSTAKLSQDAFILFTYSVKSSTQELIVGMKMEIKSPKSAALITLDKGQVINKNRISMQ